VIQSNFACLAAAVCLALSSSPPAAAADQPRAIFHAFDQPFTEIEGFVCELANQGYSHVQIPPAQRSSTPTGEWYFRYQPIDFNSIEGRGNEAALKRLIDKAHSCKVKVIADVVFNHMTSHPDFVRLDKFPGLQRSDFHGRCDINYKDGKTDTEVECWLNGDLPDLKQESVRVREVQKKHIKKLLALGIDGFRFDAAKHMAPAFMKEYIDFIDQQSHGNTWNYLEVIGDADTPLTRYSGIAAVTDFTLYDTLTAAFKASGDVRALRVPTALDDARSVTFGGNHDTRRKIGNHERNSFAINPCDEGTPSDCHLAGAYVLARESGTPLVLNEDNLVPYIRAGVKFRQVMQERGRESKNVREHVLAVVDSPTLLVMERGEEGFFVLNKAAEVFDVSGLDMTLTHLEGCYRELRNNFTVAIERNIARRKYVTRWGTRARGGMQVHGRDALYFIRDPIQGC
jgi:alpha-amylase